MIIVKKTYADVGASEQGGGPPLNKYMGGSISFAPP